MEDDNDLEQVSGSPTSGENEFVHIESVDSAQMDGGSIDQVERLEQDDGVVITGVDTVQDEPPGVKTTEDAGPDEFVDCPDDLISNEGRSPGLVNRVRQLPFGRHTEDTQRKTSDNETKILPPDEEEERRVLVKEVSNLHHQLKALNNQQPQTDGIDAGASRDQLTLETVEGGETEKPLLSLHEMVKECSKFIEISLNERSQSEDTIRELNDTLRMKEKEIEDLMVRVTEHSTSQDVALKLDEMSSVEATVDKILYSFATVIGDTELPDTSVSGKLSHLERSTSILLEQYHSFLSEIEMLSHCLAEVKPGFHAQNGTGIVFLSVREELLDLKRKELELTNKNTQFEYQHGQLMEQLEKGKETVELLNLEIGKLKGEVEQEKTRYINSKEKLSMAVTKGKALVQQRDTLKQAVAEKTSELERCLAEMQEKSAALELRNNELMQTAIVTNSLQEALSQRDMILGKCAEILLLSGVAAEIQSSDIIEGVTWLANERARLAPLSMEFQRLTYALSSLGSPESPTLESQVSWLMELYNMEKDQSLKLQDQNHATMEAARAQIDRLTASLLAESQEKYYLKEEIEDLTCKYEEIVKEKEQMKEQSIASTESSFMEKEVVEKIQSLLYVKDQESKLYEEILEDDKMNRLQLDERIRASKDHNNSLQINLQRSEEKASLLREKLSMAVKKGKGLVQERESMKQQMAEKNAQIEALTLDLQKQESTLSASRDQINILSIQVENLAKLESDFLLLKQERDQLEQFLFQSNTMLQQVLDAIDGVILPVDIKEPVEKVNWLATYLSESQVAMAQTEHELGYVKDEAGVLATKLTEALTTMKNLEDALSVSERNLSQLSEEKRKLEISRTSMEEELQKAREESYVLKTQSEQEVQILNEEIIALNKKLVEALKNLKSVEDSLSDSKKTITQLTEEKRELVLKFQEAENNISVVMNEKEEAQAGKFSAEMELQKVKEEVSVYATNLDKAYKTITSLEDAMSELKSNVSQFSQENEKAQGSRSLLESDIKKVKEEAEYHERKFMDASATIKTLENTVSDLLGEKKNAEISISTLKTELNTCRQELSGFFGNLQVMLKDESLFSLFKQTFEKKTESLQEIDHILKDIKYSIDSEQLQEESFQISTFIPHDWASGDFNTEDTGKTLDNLNTKNQILADQFVRFSRLTDDMIESLLKKVEELRNSMPLMIKQENEKEIEDNRVVMLQGELEKVKEENDLFHRRVIEMEREIKVKEGELITGLQRIIEKLGGDDYDSAGIKKSGDMAGQVAVVERLVHDVVLDSENSRSRYLESQKSKEELSTRVKHLEDFIQNRTAEKMQQERSLFEPPSLPARSEISEIEDQTSAPVGKVGLPMVASAPHIRSLRKGSNDQLAITIDSDSERLLNETETVGDKGHLFKSLNTSGLVPVKGKMIADRIDGIWVSGHRAMMRRPGARLGFMAYWLMVHLWVLGTIL